MKYQTIVIFLFCLVGLSLATDEVLAPRKENDAVQSNRRRHHRLERTPEQINACKLVKNDKKYIVLHTCLKISAVALFIVFAYLFMSNLGTLLPYIDKMFGNTKMGPSIETALVPTNQMSFPPSSQMSFPPTNQMSFPPSSQMSFPPTNQTALAPTNQMSFPPSSQMSFPPSSQTALAPTSQTAIQARGPTDLAPINQMAPPSSSQTAIQARGPTDLAPINQAMPHSTEMAEPYMNIDSNAEHLNGLKQLEGPPLEQNQPQFTTELAIYEPSSDLSLAYFLLNLMLSVIYLAGLGISVMFVCFTLMSAEALQSSLYSILNWIQDDQYRPICMALLSVVVILFILIPLTVFVIKHRQREEQKREEKSNLKKAKKEQIQLQKQNKSKKSNKNTNNYRHR
ncbi:hypothetical protein NECID01_0687 [Nematocida sp. AWRm77]|nr:hypothetical protein NECID01_0687 [Nematocida sp. AWRm77]